MEAEAETEKRSSLRTKRKPLSDCTNTLAAVPRRKNLSSSAAAKSQTLIKPPKSSNLTTATNPDPPTSSSLKSNTSTRSNNSPSSHLSELPSHPNSLRDAGGRDRQKSGLPADQAQVQDADTRKDKGKMVIDTSIIQLSAPLTSHPLQKSSAASGRCSHSGTPAVQSQQLHAQTGKKEKMAVVTPIIHFSAPLKSHSLKISSSAASGHHPLSGTSANQSCLLVQRSKDKGKMVLATPNIDAFEPSTPHALLESSSSASGTCERERPGFLTVYDTRKASEGRKHAGAKINLPLSCPPDKRRKKTGVGLDDGGSDNQPGSNTDPLPVHKKKRSRNKQHDGSVHAMAQDEVEKLRAYYADIDAFELPEEEASESELE